MTVSGRPALDRIVASVFIAFWFAPGSELNLVLARRKRMEILRWLKGICFFWVESMVVNSGCLKAGLGNLLGKIELRSEGLK